MSSELIFPATADGVGRLRFEFPEVVANELRYLAGKRLRVQVKRQHETRKIAQNNFQWAFYGDAVGEATELVELETGQPVFKTREDVHGFGKLMLLRRPVMTNRGEVNLLGTTTTLSVEEHVQYMNNLAALLANKGVYVPEYQR